MPNIKVHLLTRLMQFHIKNVISNIFIKLIPNDLDQISRFTILLIDTIACKYNFTKENIDKFFGQISQNSNRDIISIMYLLLPYIDDKDDFKLYKKITKLEDITCMKKSNVDKYKNNYSICNYQFSRYYDLKTLIDKKSIDEYGIIKQTSEYYYDYKYNYYDLEMSFKIVLSTIDKVLSKLYINWINIIPITLTDYKSSDKYKNSFDYDIKSKEYYFKDVFSDEREKFGFWNLDLSSRLRQYGGITADDVFNTIYIFLFNQIYNSGTKWLLYEKQMENKSRPKMFIELINELIDINNLYEKNIYDTIDIEVRKSTESKWIKLLSDAYIGNETIYNEFIKCIIIKFDQKYCDEEISKEFEYNYTDLYTKLNKKDNLDDEDIFLDLTQINKGEEYYQEYLNKVNDFKKISFEVIYDFLIDTIETFKLTWYGKQILIKVNNKIILKTEPKFTDSNPPEIDNNNKKYYITYKNLYNFAKHISLPFKNKKVGTKIEDSRCLDLKSQELFINILNTDDKFNIQNVIKKTYGETPKNIINLLHSNISNYFRTNLKDLVFHTYIQAGLLNKFEIDPEITDEKLLGSSESDRKKNIKKKLKDKFKGMKDKYLSTYYYLTGDKYENLEIYNRNKQKIDWFQFTFEDNEPWFFSFAINWVSQINFYNHFINNRVLLVTGATGQGKSTEVPKLLYYALIAINLNFSARVISTQPTVIPTKSNASIIASNLGVPLKIGDYNTFSSYLQYSTQEDKHLVKGTKTFIKEVTDRTLFEEIIQNPYLKKQKIGKNDKMEITDENLYDIVIIDEAHMHNVNMDLILTFMRNVVYINNQIKLVITSATMDDDEFIYRRYYKILDDNYGFPLSSIKINFEFYGMNDIILDKIVVDRRYHISPPGQTTKYVVKDIYLENDTNSYEEAENAGLLILDQIMKKNLTGDVLFFTTTENNILRLVKYLNMNSPSYVIALPLFAKLKNKPGNWFEKIEKININLPNIIYEKSDILDIIENGDSGFKKIQPNTYSMAVIIATNVVEASVTIPTLRYVIDTGYFVSVKFDEEIEDKNITIDKIPEASRLQRRGRVGRVASGTVYYGYAKNARAHIKPRYGIVTTDITFDLFKILHGFESEDNIELYNPEFHPSNYLFSIKKNKMSFLDFISQELNPKIRKIYEKQYWINIDFEEFKDKQDYSIICNNYINPYNTYLNILNPPYNDGYNLRDILDKYGEFYIIHPDEENLKREVVTGKILYNTKNNKVSNSYISDKIINCINKLQNIKYVYFDKIIKNVTTEFMHLKKFTYYKIISDILNKEADSISFLQKMFSEDDIVKIFKTICVSSSYKCTDDIIKILALLYSINSYKIFVPKQKLNLKFNDYDNFINIWKDDISELFSYLRIMNFFIEKTEDTNQTNKKEYSKKIIDTQFDKFTGIKKKYGNRIFIEEDVLKESNIDGSVLKLFVEFYNNKYNSDKRHQKYNDKYKIKQKEKQVMIESYCTNMALDVNTIKNALRLYEKFQKIVKKQKDKINSFQNFYPVFTGTNSENIIKCFLESYLFNLSISKNNKLINIISETDIEFPKISLIYLPKGYSSEDEILCFYVLKSDMGPLGLTIINKNILDDIIPKKLLKLNLDHFKDSELDILKLTGKYQYSIKLKESKELEELNNLKKSMNSYIDNSLKIVHIKKYRLKMIKND
jgi:hypothetical protein